jgi:hypothetical protein
MIAKTKRLEIRPLKEENWREFLRLDGDPRVMKHIHQGATLLNCYKT